MHFKVTCLTPTTRPNEGMAEQGEEIRSRDGAVRVAVGSSNPVYGGSSSNSPAEY